MIRFNIADHSYKDVKETPIDEYDSITTHKSRVLAWEQAQAHLWMCGALDHGSLDENQCIHNQAMIDKDYVPKPFLEDLFEPLEWTHILATLDVCTKKITQTQFCDEEGNDIIPLCTLEVCYDSDICPLEDQPTTEASDIPLNYVGNGEILVWDKDSDNDKSSTQTYDASSESSKVESPRNITIQETQHVTPRIVMQKQNKTQLSSKQEYLKAIKAKDCIKDRITGLYVIQPIKQ